MKYQVSVTTVDSSAKEMFSTRIEEREIPDEKLRADQTCTLCQFEPYPFCMQLCQHGKELLASDKNV